MLSNRPPMTWPAYCEKFSEALKEDSTGYPKTFARYKSIRNLLRNEQIRVEAARTDPIFDASEKLSKAVSHFCRHAGASLLKDDELEDWDGFLSLYEIMGANRHAYMAGSDPVFVAFVLQAIPKQRYTATMAGLQP